VTISPISITYGTALTNTVLKSNGNATYVVNGQTVVVAGTYSVVGSSLLNAGDNQTVQVVFAPNDGVTYKNVQTSVTVNVAKATPKVSVNSVNIVVGTALNDNQLFGTATFVVNGQTVSVTGTFMYTSAEGSVLPAGKYTETVTFTPDDLTDFNAVVLSVTVNVSKH